MNKVISWTFLLIDSTTTRYVFSKSISSYWLIFIYYRFIYDNTMTPQWRELGWWHWWQPTWIEPKQHIVWAQVCFLLYLFLYSHTHIHYRFIYDATMARHDGGNWVNDNRAVRAHWHWQTTHYIVWLRYVFCFIIYFFILTYINYRLIYDAMMARHDDRGNWMTTVFKRRNTSFGSSMFLIYYLLLYSYIYIHYRPIYDATTAHHGGDDDGRMGGEKQTMERWVGWRGKKAQETS